MSRVTRREWYRRVNAAWPETVPQLTAEEAVRAARKLYRFARGRKFTGPVEVTSGNRYTAIRNGVMYVNPAGHESQPGWRGFVHLLSHYLHPDLNHGGEHARAEIRMINEVVRRGWLNGTLKDQPKPPPSPISKTDQRQARIAHQTKLLARWQTKRKRADTAIRKLNRSISALYRAAAQGAA